MIGKFQDSFQLSETEIPEIKRSWEEQGEYHVPSTSELTKKFREAFQIESDDNLEGKEAEKSESNSCQDRKTDFITLEDGTVVKLPNTEKNTDMPDNMENNFHLENNSSDKTNGENDKSKIANETDSREPGEGRDGNEGLTEEQKKEIQKKTGWSDEIINNIGSMEEAEIYMKAGLKEVEINGKKCLIRQDIDMNQTDEDGISNKERMKRGLPPITKNGERVELHHIGQKKDSPLAELTMEQHRGTGNDTILHNKTKESEIDRTEFGKERKEHWKDRANSEEEEN